MSSPDQEWEERVGMLGDDPTEEQLGTLVGEMAHTATAPGRAAVKVWLDPNRQQLGRQLLVGLDFAALMGTVYADPNDNPTSRSWLLSNMVESELHLRGQIASKLREALFDKALVEDPELNGVAMEETPPKRRVCDDAYLLLRKLFHPEEDQVGFSVEQDAYLKMPNTLRDEAIERALIECAWNLSPFDFY